MGTFTIAGTAKDRGLSRVDPRLVDILQRTAAASPYNVELFSGIRPGDRRYHGRGNAVDIVLSDPSTGQEIPNLKSSVGFPIYEQFAKQAREVQQSTYPDLAGNFRWGGYFGGGKGKYGAVDLMHFDLGPTGKMAGGSWENGLTPAQAKVVAGMGEGQVYSSQGQRQAGPGQYANLWGREPLPAPPDAQSAIASLIAPPGGPATPDMPTAAMGYAPNIPDASFEPAPPMPRIEAGPPPLPDLPPQWASATGFPEAPRRPGPGGALGVDLALSPAGMSPNMRPEGRWMAGAGGAPDASLVPTPDISPLRPAVGGPNDRRPQPPIPPSRALGIPNPPPRPEFVNIGPGIGATGNPAGASAFGPEIAIDQPAAPSPYDDWTRAFDIPGPMTRMAEDPMPERQSTQYPSMVAGRPDFIGGNPPVRDFSTAEPPLSLPPSWSPAGSFPGPEPQIGTVGAGSTGGEWFSPAPPMPSPMGDPLAARFDDAFSPGGAGQIMDLQTAFDRRSAPPTMNAQGGIDSVFGAPPAQAMPSNLAIPFAEVPGFDLGRFGGSMPAEAATIASPLPQPISMDDFNARFGGGSVINAAPTPGVTPGVVSGEMPGPMDIRPPVQGGPPQLSPAIPTPPEHKPPRQINAGAERQKKGALGRIIGGLLGGPIGALGGGMLGGIGRAGTFTPYTGAPVIQTPMGFYRSSGSAPNTSGGSTNWQHGNVGNMNATSWQRSGGGTVVVATDPFTGQTLTGYR